MSRRLAAALMVAASVAGCGAHDAPAPGPSLAVGSGPTKESALLAELYAAALRYFGTATRVQAQSDPVAALDSGAVTVAPGFTGRLLAHFAPHPSARADEQVYRELISVLPEGVAAADYTASAQDKPAAVVTSATATAWDGRDISALPSHCNGVRVGVVTGAGAPSRVGDCALPPAREYQDAASLFEALKQGAVTLAWTSTASPAPSSDLVVLTDKTSLVRAENVVPLYRRNLLSEQQVLALNGIAGELDTATLMDMVKQVDGGADPAAVAGAWIAQHPLDH